MWAAYPPPLQKSSLKNLIRAAVTLRMRIALIEEMRVSVYEGLVAVLQCL